LIPEYTLTWWQRLRISRGYHVPIGKHKREGWSGSLMFFAFKCRKHGLVIDYIHGYGDMPSCPKCADEKLVLIK